MLHLHLVMTKQCRCEGTGIVTAMIGCELVTIPCQNCKPSDVSLIKIERSKKLHPYHVEEFE